MKRVALRRTDEKPIPRPFAHNVVGLFNNCNSLCASN